MLWGRKNHRTFPFNLMPTIALIPFSNNFVFRAHQRFEATLIHNTNLVRKHFPWKKNIIYNCLSLWVPKTIIMMAKLPFEMNDKPPLSRCIPSLLACIAELGTHNYPSPNQLTTILFTCNYFICSAWMSC